jgi:glycosyltransferase involved in cell wall biosynthesis
MGRKAAPGMEKVFDKTAVFVGLARDCAATVPQVLGNISRMSRLFAESAFIFVENDSRDSTKTEIRRWCQDKPNARLISLDGLAASCPIRTIRLETARNHYLSLIRSDFRAHDFLFVLDCDEVNAAPIDLHMVTRAVEFLAGEPDRAGVFGNAKGNYYDLWALRHPVLCPGDVWEEACDYALKYGVPDDEAFRQTFSKRIFKIAPDTAAPLEVDSAFGGLGIYNVPSVLRNTRHYVGHKRKSVRLPAPQANGGGVRELGWQCCEHVSFNAGFRELGQKLFVLPYLVNCETPDIQFSPSFWRSALFVPQSPPGAAPDAASPADRPKIGRNQACPCGSGKKYKHCHGAQA